MTGTGVRSGQAQYGGSFGALALICGQDGEIHEVLHDHMGLSLLNPAPARLGAVAEEGSTDKLRAFLAEAWRQGASLGWEIVLAVGQHQEPLSFFAVRRGDSLVVFATPAAHVSFAAFEEMLRMVGEQGAELRSLHRRLACLSPVPGPDLDEFTRLNNELVNAQRDLARINLELQRQESRFRSLLRDVLVAVAVVDLNGITRFVNASCAALFGVAEEDMVRRSFPLQFGCEPLVSSGKYAAAVAQRPDGTTIPIEIACVRSSWEAEPVHVLALHDVSARVQAEADRADVERILQHDLRAPLTAIINLPQVMRMESGIIPEHLEYLNYIEAAGQRMLRMITQSLDLHRMERGEYQAERVMTDLLAAVREVMTELSSLAQAKRLGVRLTVNGADPTPGQRVAVTGARLHISGVIANLLTNALEAAPEGSLVSLDLTDAPDQGPAGGFALLSIHNLGAVPEAFRARFFEKYATHGKRSGTGLGTYSAKLIARAYGGDVVFDSSDGVSTTLTVRLPLWPT
ncbi:sensor histidine kinase [Humidesulfovibrio sp.]